MRFFIKRKRNRQAFNTLIRSALLMVSAFAVFIPLETIAAKTPEKQTEITDSAFNARKVFEKLQTSALEILPPSTRFDMLDYWDVDSVYKASNVMEGLSWLEKVAPTYLKVRVTNVSTYEIKILPEKKGRLVMTIYTVGDDVQAQDSEIKFYDESLSELPTDKYFEMPRVKDFFYIPKGSATKMKEIEEMIPFPTIAFTANDDNDNVEARLTVEQYMNQDDWNIAKLFLVSPITFKWEKDKYKLEKNP